MRKHGYQALKADGGALVKPSREIKSRKCRPQIPLEWVKSLETLWRHREKTEKAITKIMAFFFVFILIFSFKVVLFI